MPDVVQEVMEIAGRADQMHKEITYDTIFNIFQLIVEGGLKAYFITVAKRFAN